MEHIIQHDNLEDLVVLNSFNTFFLGFSRRQRTSLLAASWAVGLAGVLAVAVTFANVVAAGA